MIRVETDLKLNLTLRENEKLISEADREKAQQKEVHFIMIDGLMSQGAPGLLG